MPTIPQLPPATSVSAADELPLSQSDGVVRSASVGELLAGTQPALTLASGNLLGRVSLGAGGPEPIALGAGLDISAGAIEANGTDHGAFPVQTVLLPSDQAVLSSAGAPRLLPLAMLRGLFTAGSNISITGAGVISASGTGATSYSITALPTVSTIAATDLVGISQGGADHTIDYANLLNAQTIDQSPPAVAATDTDTFWVGQGSNVLARQTLNAIWTWAAAKLPGYRRPVVELTANTTLDGSVHNNSILLCSAPLTLTPAFANMGSGFACDVLNLSGGAVTFAAGITTSTGATTLQTGLMASLRAASYSGGTIVLAAIGAANTQAVPGQVTGLATGTPTASTVPLTWSAPALGGVPTTYTVQFRVTGTTPWTTASTAVAATGFTLAGLAAATAYDVQVIAVNATGSGAASSLAHATTAAAPALPGQVAGLATSGATAGSMVLSWSVPGSGGAVSSYTVQFRITGSTIWSTSASGIAALTTTVSGLAASTGYDFQVIAVNAAGSGPPSAIVSATTLPALPGQVTGLSPGSVTTSSVALSWNAPGSGGAPASYTVQFRVSGTTPWTTSGSGIAGLSATVSGLAASTGYDFQVFAVNASGAGTASPVVSATTSAAAATPPGQVTGLVAANPTSTAVALSWTAPASGGAPATYTVQFRVTGTTPWSTASSTVSVTSFSVTGLTASTSYDFQVIAANAAGSGPASAVATAATTGALAVPGAVTGLTAGTATSTTLPLSWAAPSSGGAVATYTVQFRVTGTTPWTTATSTLTTTSTTVSGLTAATSYDVQVFAVNASGSGTAATLTASTLAAATYTIKPGFLPPAATYTHGQTGIGINVQVDPAPPGSVMNFGWSISATSAPTTWAATATNFNVDFYGAYVNAPATAGTYFFWAQTTDAAASWVSTAISVT